MKPVIFALAAGVLGFGALAGPAMAAPTSQEIDITIRAGTGAKVCPTRTISDADGNTWSQTLTSPTNCHVVVTTDDSADVDD